MKYRMAFELIAARVVRDFRLHLLGAQKIGEIVGRFAIGPNDQTLAS
jgi:hypothetical protein